MITPMNENAEFSEVWGDSTEMLNDFRSSDLNKANFTDTSLRILYAQLYARHGSDHIRYMDAHQWKYAVFTIIFNEGIKWQVSRLKQDELESLTEDEILYGGKSVVNRTENPSTADSGMDDSDGLPTIDAQDVSINKMNKVIGYSGYLASLRDVTSAFVSRFDSLFSRVIINPGTVFFRNDGEEEE
jgi:hypothetical protein